MNSSQPELIDRIKYENLSLKRKSNANEETIKKLTTRIQKLTSDLKQTNKNFGIPLKVTSNSLKQEEQLFDYQEQVLHLTKVNAALKNELEYQRTLHSNNPLSKKKKNPYESELKRGVNLTSPKRIVALHSKPKANMIIPLFSEPFEHSSKLLADNDEISKMQALVNMLRNKLNEVEQERLVLADEVNHLKTTKIAELESLVLKSDVEKIALQKQLHEKHSVLEKIEMRYPTLEAKVKELSERNLSLTSELDSLRTNWKSEQDQRFKLEERLLTNNLNSKNETELQSLLEDLKQENNLLRREQERLFSSTKNNQVFMDQEKEILELRKRLEEASHVHEQEKEKLKASNETVKALRTKFISLEEEKKQESQKYIETRGKLDELTQKLSLLFPNKDCDYSELEEALALVRLRREKGLDNSFEWLLNTDLGLFGDRKTADRLKMDHLAATQELEKLQKMFAIQQELNHATRKELQETLKKHAWEKNEYEMRLEESSRLLDNRQSRIARLEAKLNEFINGNIDLDFSEKNTSVIQQDPTHSLISGENIIDIRIIGAKFNPAALEKIKNIYRSLEGGLKKSKSVNILSPRASDLSEPDQNLMTFVTFDFYDFATQISSLGLGLNAIYGYTSNYRVTVDDFFLEYCTNTKLIFEVYRCIGAEYSKIGYCEGYIKDILLNNDKSNESIINYIGDIISDVDKSVILGNLSYSMKTQIPMRQAIRQYKERTAALGILRDFQDDKPILEKLSLEKCQQNELILNDFILNISLPKNSTMVYIMFSFHNYGEFIMEATSIESKERVKQSISFSRLNIALLLTQDLDRFLRSSELTFNIFSESDMGDMTFLTKAQCKLGELAHGEIIKRKIPCSDSKNTLQVKLSWKSPYILSHMPIATIYDEDDVKNEMNEEQDLEFKGPKSLENLKHNVKSTEFKEDTSVHAQKEPTESNLHPIESIVNETIDIIPDHDPNVKAVEKRQDEVIMAFSDINAVPKNAEVNNEKIEPKHEIIHKEQGTNIDNYDVADDKDSSVNKTLGSARDEKHEELSESVQYSDKNFDHPENSSDLIQMIPIEKAQKELENDDNLNVNAIKEIKKHNVKQPLFHSKLETVESDKSIQFDTRTKDIGTKLADNSTAESQNMLSLSKESFKIQLKKLSWYNDENVPYREILKNAINLNQFFISFLFLDYPAEELETAPYIYDMDIPDLDLDYSKEFSLNGKISSQKFKDFLNEADPKIVFTLVTEPFSEDLNQKCVDFGYAVLRLDLERIRQNEGICEFMVDILPNMNEEIVKEALNNSNATIPLGRIEIVVSGSYYEKLKEMPSEKQESVVKTKNMRLHRRFTETLQKNIATTSSSSLVSTKSFGRNSTKVGTSPDSLKSYSSGQLNFSATDRSSHEFGSSKVQKKAPNSPLAKKSVTIQGEPDEDFDEMVSQVFEQ